MTQWRTTPLATDWDGDGLPDLVMLDPEGYLALYRRALRKGRRVLLPPVRVFLDEATGRPIRLNDGVAGKSGRRKLCTTDWDGDGRKDFFSSSSLYHQYETGVSVDFWRQTRTEKGVWYFRNMGRLSPTCLHGHSCAPTPVDFNADGIPDILVGGEDGFFYYLRNPRSTTTARPTFMVNEDPWYFIGHRPASEMNAAGLRRHVDRYAAGGKVTHLVFCVNGMRTAYPSAVTDPMWRTVLADGTVIEDAKNRMKAFFDAGIDPFQVWIDRCRETGISPWVSMRINDIHHITSGDPRSSCAFWRKHPELRRSQEDPVTSGKWWTAFAFNYAKAEVRDYAFSLFKEIADRYDADGYELDTLRFQEHLTPGHEREEAHFLTEFILRCRAYTRELERQRGHRILLSARALPSYEASRAYGFDPEAWAREGAVDQLVICNFFNTVDYEFDFADWKARIRAVNPQVRVLPGATDCFDCEACRLDADAYRGWADQMHAQGADGVYLYNTSYLPEAVKEDLCRNGLASDAVRARARRYPRTHHDCVPKGLPTGRHLPVPLDRARTFPLVAGRGARTNDTASVVLGVGAGDAPAPAVAVNGIAATGTPIRLQNNATFGPDRKTKAVWRYRIPVSAVKPGENLVRVEPRTASKDLLQWVEIDLHVDNGP